MCTRQWQRIWREVDRSEEVEKEEWTRRGACHDVGVSTRKMGGDACSAAGMESAEEQVHEREELSLRLRLRWQGDIQGRYVGVGAL